MHNPFDSETRDERVEASVKNVMLQNGAHIVSRMIRFKFSRLQENCGSMATSIVVHILHAWYGIVYVRSALNCIAACVSQLAVSALAPRFGLTTFDHNGGVITYAVVGREFLGVLRTMTFLGQRIKARSRFFGLAPMVLTWTFT
jgi:hypothetical protein